VLGVIMADRFLVQRADHGRTDASQLLFGTAAGSLMGAGVAALATRNHDNPRPVFALAAIGGLAGIIGTEYYLNPAADAGRPRFAVSLSTAGLGAIAMRTPGNHSVLNVRF
jgi:hypothetical protein